MAVGIGEQCSAASHSGQKSDIEAMTLSRSTPTCLFINEIYLQEFDCTGDTTATGQTQCHADRRTRGLSLVLYIDLVEVLF